jgi:hypothetical protein
MGPGARWVHRRVETVSWIDERIWRRKVSIDFTIPNAFPRVRRRGGRDLFYMPVASLQKWPPLLGLDLDSHEVATHLLTSNTNRMVDEALLTAFGQLIAGRGFAACIREQAHRLTAETDLDAAAAAYAHIEAAVPASMDRDLRRQFLALASTMIRASMLWFPVLGHHHERNVVKFSYDEEIQVAPRQHNRLHRLAAGLAWTPALNFIELDHIGNHASYHVDVSAPEGLVVGADPRLFLIRDSATEDDEDDDTLADMQSIGQRLHAYVKASRPAKAFLAVPVATKRQGFLSGAWIASAGITLMLFFFWRWTNQVAEASAASVAILVLVPLLLGFIAVRPVVHPVTVRHIARVRDLLMLSGGLSVFAAIGLLRFAKESEWVDAHELFGWILIGEILILVLVSVSWLRSRQA